MPRYDDTVAYAANWKAVLAVDAGLGVLALAVGIVLMVTIHLVMGALIGALGATYVVLVGRRAAKWLGLRRQANL